MKTVIGATLALALWALPGASQEAAPAAKEIHYTEAKPAVGKLEPFDAIDRDADGFLSWEEIRNQVVKIFHDSDADGSGSLTGDEFHFNEQHRANADMNHDGKLTQRELVAYAAAVFGRADLDNDEKLSRQEASDVKEKEDLK